ncbi:MAG: PKD domain-containing protein [Prevotella sp.]|nr:PKD domain-containing protein [Prevotella sp.]MCM1074957.1 hypothetical protein [Ruminococcus sp.]
MKKVFTFTLTLASAATLTAGSPFIAKVHEFCPAPGQFINTLPEVTADMLEADVIAAVEEQIAGDERPGMISLGAFGGYVIFSFDHPIVNVAGQYDFKIFGNSFAANQAADGGSSEPGIVMVSVDENGDGIPNDPWYELKGSEHDNPETYKNYTITYKRPSQLDKAEDILWTSNDASRPAGTVNSNKFHTQPYWPVWLKDAEVLEFTGTRLPDNAYDQSGNGSYWVQRFFQGGGYVDNLPDFIQDPEEGYIANPNNPGFNIEDAIDSDGNKVKLDRIDFIKVYCAMNQMCGQLGETSTEICGGRDLHPEAQADDSGIANVCSPEFSIKQQGTNLNIHANKSAIAEVYSSDGKLLLKESVREGNNTLSLASLPAGLAIVRVGAVRAKVLIP